MLVLLVPGPGPLAAQSDDLIARVRENWRWARFTPESGLPTTRIVEVLESGAIPWVAADTRVAWFDGHRWRSPHIPESIQAPVTFLTPDGVGGAWGVSAGRVIRVTTDSAYPLSLLHGTADDSVVSVAPLGPDDLLLLTRQGLYRHTAGGVNQLPVPGALARARLLRTRPGTIWFIGEAVWRWDGEGRWDLWFGRRPTVFRETEAGGLMTVTEGSPDLYEWSPGDPAPRRVGQGLLATAASLAPQGDAVVTLNDAMVLIRQRGVWDTVVQAPEPLDYIRQVVHREDGDFWTLGPRGLSLFRGAASRWSSDPPPQGSDPGSFINVMVADRRGAIWMGALEGLIVEEPDGSRREITSILDTPISGVTALAVDTSGAIWVGSGGRFTGAFRWDGARWTRFTAASGLITPRVHAIKPDRQGGLWFLGLDSTTVGGPGALRWDGATFAQWDSTRGLRGGRVYAFAEGTDGAYWFGTEQGLSRWREGVWKHWEGYGGPVGSRVYSLAAATDGGVWFGSRNVSLGLGRITPRDEVVRYPVGVDPAFGEVAEIQVVDGVVWYTTHGGLGLVRDGHLTTLGRASGLTTPRLWGLLHLGDRVLVGGTVRSTLDLEEFDDPAPAVDVAVPVVSGGEVLVRWLPLAWWGNQPSDQIETRYRIDGGAWSEWAQTRFASLFGLAPGRHRIEVMAKGLFGQVGDPAAMEFVIPAPWYRSAPFLGLLLILAAGGVWAAHQARQRIRRHRDEAAREAEWSRRIAEAMPSALLQVRLPDGLVLYANSGASGLFGRDPEALVGRTTVTDLIRPEHHRRMGHHLGELTALEDGRVLETELWLGPTGDRDRLAAVRSTVFSTSEARVPDTALCVFHDITEHHDLTAQLTQAQKMETVGRLAGGVAHDFNNVLTAIAGYAELARGSLTGGEGIAEDLDEISRATERARALTSKLLVFARREIVEPRVLDLNAVTTGISTMLRRLVGESVELRLDLAAGLWPIRIDPSQVEQVLVNLVVNARDAMPGGGTIEVSTRNASTWEGVAGEVVLLTVRDNGHGMPPSVRDRIFEPFFTTKPAGKGTGLGLSTCYGIVTTAGGTLHVESAVGEGTSITVVFPRSREPLSGADPVEAMPAPVAGAGTILLVEDEEQVRQLAARTLQGAGYRVVQAASGPAALTELDRMSHPPDLILADVVMPEMSGPQLWEAVRGRCPGTRIMFMSGYTEDTDMLAHVADKSIPFLVKPFSLASLRDKVREVLGG